MPLRINCYRIPHYITAYGTDGMPFSLFCTGRLIIPVPIKTDRRLFRTCFPCNGNRNRGCFVYFLIIPRIFRCCHNTFSSRNFFISILILPFPAFWKNQRLRYFFYSIRYRNLALGDIKGIFYLPYGSYICSSRC